MSISTWACSEVFGFWCSYVLPVSVPDLLDSLMHLAQLTSTLSLFISLHMLPLTILFYLLLCPSTHTFPVCFVSLCLSGSVLQCSDFFLHLPFTQYSKVPNLILSPSLISFNGLASDVTMYLNQPSGKPPGHYGSLLHNIQLVFNERLLLSDTLSPCFPIAPIPGLD